MKMVRAIIRPEKEKQVVEALDKNGYSSMTKMHIFGRGKQKGIQVGPIVYDELPKILLMIVAKDEDISKIVNLIESNARTGNIGDGKIFISEVDEVYTIRTGNKEL
ncbi:P-II family nitrogen regulator [Thermoanaerobacterium thermosaccharolyticum]|uniref:Nitrogen regulatory protein P-II n=1 Tax=Thermoanaerobacterium thermosaccharolyticum (strain ATCC 7956 / DSM 571 / NCIMB 9385 / NCA 3814 / NCTC 13789 / WDCM 00135 / 2032) TaxID=580327 RepID=D9TS52_THETC|nr:P-II family nitrogen regulator [Thermoanaerobacterium thermosaccharolyticum]ADL69351.1 nitrogen regulatory protein P-II [Thermoanaerobacterium thermosaccharolyticum DSM 571]KAA5807872.1 P-II family nitrogen regulator [Thermoanaerobacterium thermosaccharolyticum]PHO08477.1 nitrogen fixation protein NifD [Thermoanaerobacterium thermosaccharolyticum]TCW39571.1 nitrogen regulatory protein P-II family [Thermohydrogenium kirishiense]